jgi:hypothetical protein
MNLLHRLTDKDRLALRHFGTLTVAKAGLIDYSEADRTGFVSLAQLEADFQAGIHQRWDCGTGVCEAFYACHLADPQGKDYAELGYTGYLLAARKHYSDIAHSKTGAIMIFGAGEGEHACFVMQPDGDDPWLWSMGSEIGPLYIRYSEERLAHVGQPVTMLDVGGLG